MQIIRIFHCGRWASRAIVEALALKEDQAVFLWRNLTPTAVASAAAAVLRTRPAAKPATKPVPPPAKE
jgi:hypothetical protein